MSYTITRTNYLDVNGVPLSTPAWEITNLEPEIRGLLARGSDLDLPGATGSRRRRRFRARRVMQFELNVYGLHKWDGTNHANAIDGFNANCDQLAANLGLFSSSPITATWHLNGSTTRTASVDIESLLFSDLGSKRDGLAVLELSVPAGAFA